MKQAIAFLTFISFVFTSKATEILTPNQIQSLETNLDMPFETHSNALALNVVYAPIKELRKSIKQTLNYRDDLNFLKAWSPNGEAHVTVITPPEYEILSKNNILNIEEINKIAENNHIQGSHLKVFGIGHGKKFTGTPQEEETFFVLVDSQELRFIRTKIYEAFVNKGGNKNEFDPNWFFPHITIGYTKNSDIHEQEGVLKNIKHSWDLRLN